jgi:hypothetical protein
VKSYGRQNKDNQRTKAGKCIKCQTIPKTSVHKYVLDFGGPGMTLPGSDSHR